MRSVAVSNRMLKAAQASYDGNPDYGLSDSDMRKALKMALREAPDQQSDLAAARAEIERLTKERDLSKELLRSCIQGNNVLRKKAQKAIAERDEARSMLADAERDMRQRAADTAKEYCDNGYGHIVNNAILALPLKHADQGDQK